MGSSLHFLKVEMSSAVTVKHDHKYATLQNNPLQINILHFKN